jgi:ATP-dependent helicase/nuclease subunit B
MAVTFVIGRAGSGKTARIFRRITNAARAEPLGPPIIWLLPKQATFMAERELTCAVGAFSRVRVLSFEGLGRMIEADCGGAAVPEVTDLGRQMVLGHLLRRHQGQLGFFASVARRPGLAAELDATFAEFERSGKTTAELADLLDQLKHADPADAEGPSLQAKLRDLLLLYDAYTRYLAQERLDQHRRLMQVREKLEQCASLRPATVYVDNFADFTDYERRILVGLAKTCRSVEVALLLDPDSPTVRHPHHLPDELSLFHRTETTYRKLWFAMTEEGVELAEPVKLEEARRFRVPTLKKLEASLFEVSPNPQSAIRNPKS